MIRDPPGVFVPADGGIFPVPSKRVVNAVQTPDSPTPTVLAVSDCCVCCSSQGQLCFHDPPLLSVPGRMYEHVGNRYELDLQHGFCCVC